jgi:tetratricopeptide (TPR) repeat protein
LPEEPGTVRARLLALTLVALALACARKAPAALTPSAAPAPPTAAAQSWYLQAVIAEERGDLDHAALAWAWLAREDTSNPHAHAHHARFLQRQRRWAEAHAAWSKASARDPAWWEPYAARAALAGRSGDGPEERRLLREAVDRGADGDALERLIELHERAGEGDPANAVLDLWLAREVRDVDERRRRAWAATRLGREPEVIGDLRAALAPRAPASARAFVAAASAACRLDEALAWARQVAPGDPTAPEALAVAVRAGDLATIELHAGLDGALGAAPRASRPPGWARSVLALVGAPAVVRAAEGWIALGFGPRGEALLDRLADEPELRGWVAVTRALLEVGRDPAGGEARLGTGDGSDGAPGHQARGDGVLSGARLQPADVSPDAAQLVAWSVSFLRGDAAAEPTAAALRGLGPPDLVARVLGRLDGPGARAEVHPTTGDAIAGRDAAPDRGGLSPAVGALLLPVPAHDAWRDEREALAAAGPSPSHPGILAWAERSPADPRLGPALAPFDASRAIAHLARTLAADPCDAEALAARARLAPAAERPAWEMRLHRADPLRPP